MSTTRETPFTNDDYANDARAAHALYTSMTTDELRRLCRAFELDIAAPASPETIAFGGGRIALITAVLQARAER